MLEPVVRSLTVACTVEQAFTCFTHTIGEWWPSAFSAGGDNLATVTIEPFEGGRVYETSKDGGEYDWGSVLVWEAPTRIVLTWTLGLTRGDSSEVEVAFSDGSLRLTHSAWIHEADRAKFDDAGGWTRVLTHFVAAATPDYAK